jgi:phosphoribosylformylglycinamidine cyclo-ligase
MTTSAYAQDGVDIEAGDDFSAFAGQICRSTWGNSRFVKVHDFSQHFRGPRGYNFKNLPRGWFEMGAPDGIGTKVALTTESRLHRYSAHDLYAMGAGDITRWGGMPVAMFNVLDVSSLGAKDSETRMHFEILMKSLKHVADFERIALIAGETAELGVFVGSENPTAVTKYNWAGFVIGVNHKDKIITGQRIQSGDAIVALQEPGFRSNGISAVRKALALKYGSSWWSNPLAQSSIVAAAQPSMLYDRFLSDCNGWLEKDFEPRFDIHGIVHISGGGIPGKLFEDILVPLGLSANLPDLFDPPEIMQKCAEWRGQEFTAHECYKVWGGGQGMLVIMPKSEVKGFVRAADAEDIVAKECGTIVKRPIPELRIRSKFLDKSDRDLVYRA